MAKPKPYFLRVLRGGYDNWFTLYADDRLYHVATDHPALRELDRKEDHVCYKLNPRYDADEVEAELRQLLDAEAGLLQQRDESLWEDNLPDMEDEDG